ncbi:MAG: hypothetical protein AAGC97_05575 [Planctomycetota bacterium]
MLVRLGGILVVGIGCFVFSGSDAAGQGYGFGTPQSNGFYGGLSNMQLAPNHPTRPTTTAPTTRRSTNRYYYGGNALVYPPVYGGTLYGDRFGVGRPTYGYGYGGAFGGTPYGGYPYGYVPNYGTQLNVYPNGIIQTFRGPVFPRR